MFKDKKLLILGMAKSGYSCAKVLASLGNKVILNDIKSIEEQDFLQVEELKNLGVELFFGSHPDDLLDDSFDYLVKNPGIRLDHKYVLKAEELNIPVINEVEVGYHLLPDNIKLIGITGTNGKTTTTTLTYEILKEAFGSRVHLVGNIGFPLCSILDDIKEEDILVMEVSCQQSTNFIDFKPDIALITNYSPAHIDFLGTYENYKFVKSKMFRNQKDKDISILNFENNDVMNEMKNIKSEVKYFSSIREISGGYLKDNNIYYYDEEIISINDIKIPGIHNVENCISAIMISKEFDVSNDIIKNVISNFRGVEHRLEYVDTVRGVRYYNDTEATNIKCSQIALSSFKEPTIIILGGLERGQDFSELSAYMNNVKSIIGIGECRQRVLEFGSRIGIDTYIFEHLKDSFVKIREIAESGDVVLLSPASASWDQYERCEVRGDEFKKFVRELNDL